MDAAERLDDHQLGPQQADAVDVEVRHPLELGRLGEVDEELVPSPAAPRRRVGRRGRVAGRRQRSRRPRWTTPRAASTVTSSPSRSVAVAVPVPTRQGMPSSRETIAAWQVMPPESVTIAAARRISGTQSGAVMWVTSTSPSRSSPASASDGSPAPVRPRCPARRRGRATAPGRRRGPWPGSGSGRRGSPGGTAASRLRRRRRTPTRCPGARRSGLVAARARRSAAPPRRRGPAGRLLAGQLAGHRAAAVDRLDHQLLVADLAAIDRQRRPCRRRSGQARPRPRRPPRRGRRRPRSPGGRRGPMAGSIVNITPARVDSTWRWTTTAMSISAWREAPLGPVVDGAGAEQRGPAARAPRRAARRRRAR